MKLLLDQSLTHKIPDTLHDDWIQQNRYMSLTSLAQTRAMITANVIDADTTKEVA